MMQATEQAGDMWTPLVVEGPPLTDRDGGVCLNYRHLRSARGLCPRSEGTPLWCVPLVLGAMVGVGLALIVVLWALAAWTVVRYVRERVTE